MRGLHSPLFGLRTPFTPGAGGVAAFAVNGFTPELVFDFDGEAYYTGRSLTTFDSAMTHTGASTRTMVDSDGLLKWAPHNLATYSEEFDNAAWTKNNSTVDANATVAPDGSTTAERINGDATGVAHFLLQSVAVSSGVKYTLSAFLKSDSIDLAGLDLGSGGFPGSGATRPVYFDLANGVIDAQGASVEDATITSAGNGWYLCTVTQTADATTNSSLGLAILYNGASPNYDATGDSVFVWGAHLYRSDLGGMVNNPDRSDSYVPTTSAAVYMPRRNSYLYNGSSWVNEGLYLESEARTNLVTYSEDFTDASWVNFNSSDSLDSTGPDGETSAFTLVDDGGGGTSPSVSVYQSVSGLSATTAYTFSVFAKADQLSWACLRTTSFTDGPGNDDTFFNLSSGSVGTIAATIDSATIEDWGNGWYRCSITFTTGTDGAGNLQIHPVAGDADRTVDLDGTSSILIYGAQFEEGSTPSSYIPTSGATATRAAETLTVAAADLPYDATNMSIQMDGKITYADTDRFVGSSPGSGESCFVYWVVDANNCIDYILGTGGVETGEATFRQKNAGTADVVRSATDAYSPGVNISFNIAGRNGATFINGAVDGVALTEDATPIALPDLSSTDLDLGSARFAGHITQFRMWDDDIGDTGLEQSTS